MRYLGIDYGTKNIGIATSNKEGTFAFPHSVVKNNEHIFNAIKKIIQEEEIERIVLGESVNYKGEPNPVMEKINEFKQKLEEETSLSVVFQKEILTTREAERIQGKTESLDASAAALILRSYLEQNPQ